MNDEDRKKLCDGLRDPWEVTVEELAELAGVAADEIERQAAVIEQLRGEAAPASVARWWARSKHPKPVEQQPQMTRAEWVIQTQMTRAEWVEHRIKHIEDTIAEVEAKQKAETSWGAAVGARHEWLRELRSEVARLREGRGPTRHHAGLPPPVPYPAEESESAK